MSMYISFRLFPSGVPESSESPRLNQRSNRSNMRSFRALTCSFGLTFKISVAVHAFFRDFALAKSRQSSISRLPGSSLNRFLRPKRFDFRAFSPRARVRAFGAYFVRAQRKTKNVSRN